MSIEQDIPLFEQLAEALFCAGCNARFAAAEGKRVCPRCGATVGETGPTHAPTMLVRDAVAGAPTPPNGADDELDHLIGTQLHVYHCESLLGAGGMGRVYLARHCDLDRYCALKILAPRLAANDPDYVSRFLNEGRAAAALNHPNIITTHAIGQERGYYFLEMEFLAGRSLQRLLQDEGRMSPVRATALVLKIAEGLAAAHRQNILHRDLKPDNVMLNHQGIPKIADFGLAKRVKGIDAGRSEELAGTPNFMAPELFQGEHATPASDIYALGVTYFVLLAGRYPFTGRNLNELMHAVATQPVPRIRDECPELSLEMAECLNLLMAKSPANRPRDAVEASQLLQAVLGHVRDLESLLEEAFRDVHGVQWTRDGGRFRIQIALPEERRQTAFVEPSHHAAAERLLIISSTCCPARPDYYEAALRLNAEILHGGLALREIDGQLAFLMMDTYPRGTVDPEEIRRSVLEVAHRADAIEKLLTGHDRY